MSHEEAQINDEEAPIDHEEAQLSDEEAQEARLSNLVSALLTFFPVLCFLCLFVAKFFLVDITVASE